MRRVLTLIGVFASAAMLAPQARAADWVMLLGAEEGRPEKAVTPVAFTQVIAESTPLAEPVEGLKAPANAAFNGETPTFNVDGPVNVAVRRARLGARGTVPHTHGLLTYFAAIDAGTNAGTRGRGVNLFDASLSFHGIPGARIRVGQFKLPVMDETLESNPLTADFISFSPVVQQLVLEQPVVDGRFAGPGFSNRDVGAQVFDSFLLPLPLLERGGLELSYALMASQGQTAGLDPDAHKDLSARVTLSLLADARERYRPWRRELSLFAWHLRGARDFEGSAAQRVRQGVGAHARAFGLRGRVEVVQADGMLFTGQTPPFDGQPILVDPRGTAWGYTGDLSLEMIAPFELNVRLAELFRYQDGDPRARHFRTVALGAQWKWSESVKVLANWEMRSIFVPPGTPPDARAIAGSIGDLVSVQLVAAL